MPTSGASSRASSGAKTAPWGVVFDLDGTLVDSVWHHALAWSRALDERRVQVPIATVHRLIGLQGADIAARTAGEEGDGLPERARAHFRSLRRDVRALPGAAQALRAIVAEVGVAALASSSPPEDVAFLLRRAEIDRLLPVVVTADDIEAGKPDADPVCRALERAGLAPERAVLIGDSVWDLESARRAGVAAIGVTTGASCREALLEAGAVAVYDNLPAMLRDGPPPLGALARWRKPAGTAAGVSRAP